MLYATHKPSLSWMNPYDDERGRACCGIYDCVEVEARVIEQRAGLVIVDVNGVQMKLPQGNKNEYTGRTHFHSNDNTDYWCYNWKRNEMGDSGLKSVGGILAPALTPENTRCVFISFGG